MSVELEDLKRQATEDYLRRRGVDIAAARANNTVCPVCGNGVRTGCFHYYPDTFRVKCFSCGFSGDMFDLIAQERGIGNAEAIQVAMDLYGPQPMGVAQRPRTAAEAVPAPQPQKDYSDFISQAERANDFTYLLGRGISEATQRHFHVGYCAAWINPQAVVTTLQRGGDPGRLPSSPRCIIPRNRYNYLARDTRDPLSDEQKRYSKQNAGKTSLFNQEALRERVVYVVEGEIDAMSVYQVGGNACGLCSVANRGLLLNYLKEHTVPGQCFVLMLDNDDAGKAGTEQLEKGLQDLGVPYICAEYPAEVKDPNDYLQRDAAGFEAAVSLLTVQAIETGSAVQGNEYRAAELLDYFRYIESQPAGFEAKTGFEVLDTALSGGLHEGLYILGAVSSLGKTTFALQLADQIAERGQDVLFFSLEMSKLELMAKSISRHTYDLYHGEVTIDGKRPIARDTQQVLNNRRYTAYDEDEKRAIATAIADYERQAQHVFIHEGRYMGQRLAVTHIREIVRNHIRTYGNRPVVFVDYLQILAPTDVRATDKQNTDAAVFELKEISRDFRLPVFAISSFNRENYLEPVSMTSFKESGAVEYSSDVLFGLQYTGMDYQDGDSDKARRSRIRDLMDDVFQKKRNREPIPVQLKCLKHRNGYNFTVEFRMLPAYNHFEAVVPEAQVRTHTAGRNRI